MKNKKEFANNFTMIHIMAALMVMVGHQFILTGNSAPSIMGMSFHGLGVKILFLVSGYLVSASFIREPNIGKYLIKRISRIYPPLILCLIMSVVVLSLITNAPGGYLRSAWTYLWQNIAMSPKFDLAGVFTDNPYPVAVNGSLWTLPIELACYLLIIPVILIIKFLENKKRYAAYIFAGLLLAVCSIVDYGYTYGRIKAIVVWGTDWTAGVMLAVYFFIGVILKTLQLEKIFSWQIGVVIIVLYNCLPQTIYNFAGPYMISYLVMCFGLAEKPIFEKVFKRDICYGMYLYAFPVQQVVIYLFTVKLGVSMSVYLLLLISVVLTVILAEMQYWLLEQPSLISKTE